MRVAESLAPRGPRGVTARHANATKEDKRLAAAKLATSGLDLRDAKLLSIETLGEKQTGALFPKSASGAPVAVPALKLNYFDVLGKLIKGMCRVRVLAEVVGPFGQVHEKLRYLQPADTPPSAYFAKTRDWRRVVGDASVPVIFTEGELKAACAVKHGYACIGLGGVYNYRSAAQGWDLLPELEAFTWVDRDVFIVYDSDAATNPQVVRAQLALAQVLTLRGAKVRIAELPDVYADGRKTGLDDFLVARSQAVGRKAAIAELNDVLAASHLFVSPFERGDHVELAACLVADRRKAAPFIHDEGAFYSYDEARGIFVPVDNAELSAQIQAYAGRPVGVGS